MENTKYYPSIEKTKTYTYLFEPSLIMFHTELVSKPLTSYANGIRIINIFLTDLKDTKHKIGDGILHILCDLSQPEALVQLKNLKESSFYEGCYLVSRAPLIGVILLRTFRGKSFQKFLESKYSEMYSLKLLEAYKEKFLVKVDNKINYSLAYRVLTADITLKRELVALLAENENDAAHLEKQITELASKLDLNEEVVNIKEYYERIRKELS